MCRPSPSLGLSVRWSWAASTPSSWARWPGQERQPGSDVNTHEASGWDARALSPERPGHRPARLGLDACVQVGEGRPTRTQHDQIAVHAAGDGAGSCRSVARARSSRGRAHRLSSRARPPSPTRSRWAGPSSSPLQITGTPAPRVDQRACEAQGGRRVGDARSSPVVFGRPRASRGGGSPARPPVVVRGLYWKTEAGRR